MKEKGKDELKEEERTTRVRAKGWNEEKRTSVISRRNAISASLK